MSIDRLIAGFPDPPKETGEEPMRFESSLQVDGRARQDLARFLEEIPTRATAGGGRLDHPIVVALVELAHSAHGYGPIGFVGHRVRRKDRETVAEIVKVAMQRAASEHHPSTHLMRSLLGEVEQWAYGRDPDVPERPPGWEPLDQRGFLDS
jgi:hypothetical protein